MEHQFLVGETVEVRGYSREIDGLGKYIGKYVGKFGGDYYRIRLFDYEDYFDDDDYEAYHFISKANVFPCVETTYDPTQMGDRDDDI